LPDDNALTRDFPHKPAAGEGVAADSLQFSLLSGKASLREQKTNETPDQPAPRPQSKKQDRV
jgi:hypothetical protein